MSWPVLSAGNGHEMGIRLAVGATAGGVIKLAVRQGMRPVGIGIGLGALASLACGPVLASQFHGASALDPFGIGVTRVEPND